MTRTMCLVSLNAQQVVVGDASGCPVSREPARRAVVAGRSDKVGTTNADVTDPIDRCSSHKSRTVRMKLRHAGADYAAKD